MIEADDSQVRELALMFLGSPRSVETFAVWIFGVCLVFLVAKIQDVDVR